MSGERKFLVDVGMRDLPFPMRVSSRREPDGQATVAGITINARIMQEFEARWIDRFVQIVHEHRERIGTTTLRRNIVDYVQALHATTVTIDFSYPYFVEKRTPVANERCLVRYLCTYTARVSLLGDEPKVIFRVEVPCISTYPVCDPADPGGLFGQLSVMEVAVESRQEIYPEDVVEMVDRHALAPVYSFLTEEDQVSLIHQVHSQRKTSVMVVDAVRDELARQHAVDWYSVRCSNFGMLHSYSTVIATEKSSWIPFSGYESEV